MSSSAPSHSKTGVLTSTPHEGGPVVVQDLVSCIHCGYTWVWVRGSGRMRGYCTRCPGIVCGRPACNANGCVCWRQGIENMESGRPDSYRPIIVSVTGEVPR